MHAPSPGSGSLPRAPRSSAAPRPAGPPRPPLVFRVGCVGHRPYRLREADLGALGGVIEGLLGAVAEAVNEFHGANAGLFSDDAPEVRAISPLAEGTDRLFSERGLALGYTLCCPMPFFQEEFEKDFEGDSSQEPDSLERFRGILSSADESGRLSIFELDGDRAHAAAAYEAGGRVVVNQSDLLIVVWDGVRKDLRGGTESTFDEALRLGRPAVWIDAHAPHRWQLVLHSSPIPRDASKTRAEPEPSGGFDQLKAQVRAALALPGSTADAVARPASDRPITIRDFYAERQRRLNAGIIWRLFRDLLGQSRLRIPSLRAEDFESSALREWPRDASTPLARVVDQLRPYYAWPDGLAVWYSDAYRSVSVLGFLLAAGAVFLALLPIAAGWTGGGHSAGETVCVVLELLAICVILVLVLLCRSARWHERWIDYRLTAEMLRHVRLVGPVGGGRSLPPAQAHLETYGSPGATWAAWYSRNVERAAGLPRTRMDPAFLKSSAENLVGTIRDQVKFHVTTEKRSRTIERRLHRGGIIFFSLTLVFCAIHLLPQATAWLAGRIGPELLGLLCALLPALGSACAGVNNFGEFRRVARRSGAMKERMESLLASAEALSKRISDGRTADNRPLSAHLADLSTSVSQVMLNEVLDWRIVFLDRPPDVPT